MSNNIEYMLLYYFEKYCIRHYNLNNISSTFIVIILNENFQIRF
jgi:hypothetical protein